MRSFLTNRREVEAAIRTPRACQVYCVTRDLATHQIDQVRRGKHKSFQVHIRYGGWTQDFISVYREV